MEFFLGGEYGGMKIATVGEEEVKTALNSAIAANKATFNNDGGILKSGDFKIQSVGLKKKEAEIGTDTKPVIAAFDCGFFLADERSSCPPGTDIWDALSCQKAFDEVYKDHSKAFSLSENGETKKRKTPRKTPRPRHGESLSSMSDAGRRASARKAAPEKCKRSGTIQEVTQNDIPIKCSVQASGQQVKTSKLCTAYFNKRDTSSRNRLTTGEFRGICERKCGVFLGGEAQSCPAGTEITDTKSCQTAYDQLKANQTFSHLCCNEVKLFHAKNAPRFMRILQDS